MRSNRLEVFCEKGVLKNFAKFTEKHLCQSLFLISPEATRVFYKKVFLKVSQRPKTCNFIKKETLAQVFSWDICEIFKNTFFTEHFRATASVNPWKL